MWTLESYGLTLIELVWGCHYWHFSRYFPLFTFAAAHIGTAFMLVEIKLSVMLEIAHAFSLL